MPITAIPKGVELRKITAVQKRALDELITKERGSSALTTALVVGIPSIVAGSAILAYVFKEQMISWFDKQEEALKELVKDAVVKTGETIVETVIETGNKIFKNDPVTPEQYGGSTLDRCTRWAVDATENLARTQKGDLTETEKVQAALNLVYIAKNMKSEGCSRPSAISVAQWG